MPRTKLTSATTARDPILTVADGGGRTDKIVVQAVTPQRARKLTAHEIRQVSVTAACDPRSVVALVEGRATRALTRLRIVRALRELGLEHVST